MGLPSGWVTDPAHRLTPNQQIIALGNGVLPLQATNALAELEIQTPVGLTSAYSFSHSRRH